MSSLISEATIQSFQGDLENHPVYAAVHDIRDLRRFMEHHVYSVWDFMSLIKYLQNMVAPARYPWTPEGDGNIRRFINELVLEEESDEAIRQEGDPQAFTSHFELYCGAMEEIGADNRPVLAFVDTVREQGIDAALALPSVPEPARNFTGTTFAFLRSGKPHQVAAALALGREHIIPGMFRSLLERIGVGEGDAPGFHYYLKRHIHLDEDFHAPLSLRLLNALCRSDWEHEEAIAAARQAVDARVTFWNGVLANLRPA